EPYQVMDLDLDKFPAIYEVLKDEADHKIIIDLPGKIDDDNLIPVLRAADIIMIPFHYDKMSFESTDVFASIAHELNPGSQRVFIPNMIKSAVKYDIKTAVDEHIMQYGFIAPQVPHKVALQRLTTSDLPVELIKINKPKVKTVKCKDMEMKALVDRLREAANADKKASPNTANEKPVTQSLEENKTEEKIEKGKEESKPKKQTKSKKSLTADSDSSKLINDIQQLTFDEPLLV